jgi:5-methyltetrahydrofolate--homocysteine methyltransferase
MKKIAERIKANEILISDGAWGTFLQQKGLQPGECPELWNITHRIEVLSIAQSYVDAGSNMIETNSFGANKFKLDHFGLGNRVYEINKAAAEISKQAAGENVYVLGSIGPTGKFLIMEEVTTDELKKAFREQAVAMEAGGADAIIIETFTDLEEAKCAIKAAKENTSLEVICTMTFEKTVNGDYRSMMGVSPSDMANELTEAGADIIGANCGNGMEGMIAITKEIRSINPDIPILIHANAGAPIFKDGITTFPETPEYMAGLVKKLIAGGANIIGGCCGTTPQHISKIANAVKS